MIYSVVSYRPNFDPAILRTLPVDYPPEITGRYLQLPGNISGRVKNLAQTLTQPYTNTFDKVEALSNHLRTTYAYNFFPPPYPAGAEVVDTFLFEDREGVCEQYVTALVVMARSLGIPARLVSGYGPGDYNAITGYYEVRFSHAHSWAEVYFPEYGWVPFDPTPGWNPQPYPTPLQNWLFTNNGQLLIQLAGLDLPLRMIASGGLAGLAFLSPFLIGLGGLIGLAILVILLSRRLRAALARWAAARYSQVADETQTRRRILNLYRQALRLLVRYRYPQRQPWETMSEYAAAVSHLPALAHLSRLAEMAAYRPQPPDAADAGQAAQKLALLKSEVKQPINNEHKES
jgi:hypothetical protein